MQGSNWAEALSYPQQSPKTAELELLKVLLEGFPYQSDAAPRWQLDFESNRSGLLPELSGLPVLRHPDLPGKTFQVDFTDSRYQHLLKSRSKNQPLLKAFQKHPKHAPIYDLTGGWLRDSLLLAATGFQVIAFERHPVIWFLCNQALEYARLTDERFRKLNIRYQLMDSHQLQTSDILPESSLYIDTMFSPDPIRMVGSGGQNSKRSAAVKKPSAWLRALVGSADEVCRDGNNSGGHELGLLTQTLQQFPGCRVVHKTPLHQTPSPEPTYLISGKSSQFNIYTTVPRET